MTFMKKMHKIIVITFFYSAVYSAVVTAVLFNIAETYYA